MIYKIKDGKGCSNYWEITLGNSIGKMYARMKNRLQDNTLEESLCGWGLEDKINE